MSAILEKTSESFLNFVRRREEFTLTTNKYILEFNKFSRYLNDMAEMFPNERFTCIGIERKSQWDESFPALEQLFDSIGWKLDDPFRSIGFSPRNDCVLLEIANRAHYEDSTKDGITFIATNATQFSAVYLSLNDSGELEVSKASTKQRIINNQLRNTKFRKQLFGDLTSLMSKTYAWILMDQ